MSRQAGASHSSVVRRRTGGARSWLVSVWLTVLLVLAAGAAPAAVIFQDDFSDGVVGAEFQPIGAATLSESGGKLHVSIPDAGGGLSFRVPAPLDVWCGFFDGLEIPTTQIGDWINIDLIAEDADGNVYIDSSVTLTHSHSITIAVRDKSGTMQVFKIEDYDPEDIAKQWIDKLSANRRQYELKFKDGKTWRSPAYDPPDARMAGYDITTNIGELAIGEVTADDVHNPRDALPADAVMAIDTLLLDGGRIKPVDGQPLVIGNALVGMIKQAEFLLSARDFDPSTIDTSTLTLVSRDGRGEEMGRAAFAGSTSFGDGVWRLSMREARLKARKDGYLNIEGKTVDGAPFLAAAPAVSVADAWGVMVDDGVVVDDSLELRVAVTGPHSADGADPAAITVSAIDTETGPLDLDDLQLSVLVGIDHEEVVPLTDFGGGQFGAIYATEVAGPARFRIEALSAGAHEDDWSDFTPGAPVELDATVDGFAFPDGSQSVAVIVSPFDDLGNVAGPGFAEVVVDSDLEYDLSISACEEFVFAFRSSTAGTFEATFTELTTGLTQTVALHFPEISPKRALDNPFLVEDGDRVSFEIPIAFHLAAGWDFQQAEVDVRLDPGMLQIGTLAGVVDASVGDCVEVAGYATSWESDGSQTVTVKLSRSDGAIGTGDTRDEGVVPVELCDGVTSSSFALELETNGGGSIGDTVNGGLEITRFDSDTPHPSYGTTSVPVDKGNDYDGEGSCVCIKKDYWEGCIIYVRAILPDGRTQPTEMEICSEHDKINDIFGTHCIYFKKTVSDIVLSDPEFLNNIDTAAEKAAVRQAALDALAAAGIDRGKCIIIIHVDKLGPKATTRAGDPATNPQRGTTIIEDQYFGNGRSNAHEVGHQLDGDPTTDDHAGTTPDNLMRPTDRGGRGTNLTPAQVAKYKMSGLLEKKTFEFYFCWPWFF